MEILLDDIIHELQKTGGISRYWLELTNRLERLYSPNELKRINSKSLFVPLILSRVCPALINPFSGREFIFHSSYYRVHASSRAKNILTVHDFTHRVLGHGLKDQVFIVQQTLAIKLASHVICVSQNTKEDLLRFFPSVDSGKISVVYNGVSDVFFPDFSSRSGNVTQGSQPYALFIGSRARHKNFKSAVLSLLSLPVGLVVAGSERLSNEEIEFLSENLKDRWRFYYFPNSDQLRTLYQGATCLLYPSGYEGFGIPVLEAMKCGIPVVACDNSSVREIAGPSTILVDRPEPELLKNGVIRALNGLPQDILEDGVRYASQFTWDRCFDETLDVYKRV
jgi:glycosyltransferase involved in cell wall biosynthesis